MKKRLLHFIWGIKEMEKPCGCKFVGDEKLSQNPPNCANMGFRTIEKVIEHPACTETQRWRVRHYRCLECGEEFECGKYQWQSDYEWK